MNYLKNVILCFALIGIQTSCSTNDDTSETDEQEPISITENYQELNISYGTDQDQKFDLYLPANRTIDTKTILLIHGGGWTSGDKSNMDAFRDIIKQDITNVAIVNMNYRLADINTPAFSMQLEDITTVVSYLKENKKLYTISDEYGFIGTSAGAHLAMLWSYTMDSNQNSKMVCSIVGPTNFTDTAYTNATFAPVYQEFATVFSESTTAYKESVSPYHQVTANAVPTILFYGDADPLIPTSQGTDMKAKLDQYGVINEFTLYEGEGHGWVGTNLFDTWLKTKAFLQTHLID